MENQSPLYIGNSFVYHERLYNNLNEMGLTIESDWKRFDFTFYLTNIIIGISILRLFYSINSKRIDAYFIGIK